MQSNNTQTDSAPKCKDGVKRAIKWTLISLITLVVLAIAAVIIWLGPIAEWYLEKYDTELIGRRVEMDELRVKLFKGELSAKNAILYEEDNETHFARLGNVTAEMALSEIFDNHIHITRLSADKAYLRIDQNVEEFNIDDMLLYLDEAYPEDESEEEGEPWKVTLDNITIKRSHFAYFDHEIEQRWELTELDLATPSFYLDDRFSHIDIATIINDSAALEGDLELNYETWDFTFAGTLKEFPLAETYKYWTPFLNIGSVTGLVDADFELEGNVMNIFAMNIRGEAYARNFGITTPSGGKVLLADELQVGIEELNIEKERYILSSLVANGYSSEILLAKDGSTNFDALFYNDPTITIESTTTTEGEDLYDVKERVTVTTTEEEALLEGMVLKIGHAELKGGEFLYSDDTMHRLFEYELSNIAIKGDNLDLMGDNKITLSAQLPKQGSVMLRWDGSLSDFHNQSLMLMLNNVDMVGISPYVEHFTGFPITDGNLTFRSQNVVSDGSLSGINQFGTYNFKLGKRDKSLDPEIKLPLRLAVWVLTDKDEHIDIDLPVSGHLDSPKFSYGKVIMKAVGGLMLKIAISPFELMAGNKQDAFRHIDLDLLEPGLSSEHYARLDKMAEALKEDSSVRVRLTQRVNYKRASQRLANLSLKIAYYNHTHGDKQGYLDMLAFSRINDTKMSNRDVIKYADSLLRAQGIDPSVMNTQAKAMALYGDVVEGRMVQLMELRNRIIMDYMGFQHQDLPAGSFSINNVVIEDMVDYHGKDRFTVTLIVDEEEIELPVDGKEDEGEVSDEFSSLDEEAEPTEAVEEGIIVESEGNLSTDAALDGNVKTE